MTESLQTRGPTTQLNHPEATLSGAFARLSLLMLAQHENSAACRFAHESEAEFARFLDFYRIQWRFESVCFALQRDRGGRVVESFTPDFYLPQLDLFVELTTMKQRLVTRKNRKIRRMRELYPEVRVKILYGRDYRKLLFKFGAI